MTARRILSEEEKWRDLVGGFILAFGDIELFTHHLWQIRCPGCKPAFNFRRRTTELIKVLQQDLEKNGRIIGPLTDAVKMIHKRNTVAHNPTHVEVFTHGQAEHIIVERRIASRQSKDYIDDAELTELRAAAEDVVVRLYMAIGAPTK